MGACVLLRYSQAYYITYILRFLRVASLRHGWQQEMGTAESTPFPLAKPSSLSLGTPRFSTSTPPLSGHITYNSPVTLILPYIKILPFPKPPYSLSSLSYLTITPPCPTPTYSAHSMPPLQFITPPPPTSFASLSYPSPAHILLVTLNRPKALNCINSAGNIELDAIWRWFDDEPSLRVGIVTGAGRAFCAGGFLIGVFVGGGGGGLAVRK